MNTWYITGESVRGGNMVNEESVKTEYPHDDICIDGLGMLHHWIPGIYECGDGYRRNYALCVLCPKMVALGWW